MAIAGIYLAFLLIAPQLWVPGLVGIPVDKILYPIWLVTLILRGRIQLLTRFDLADKLFVGFLVWMALSIMINGSTEASEGQLYLYLRILILYKLVSASVTSAAEVMHILLFFVFLAVILAVETIDHKTSQDLLGWAGQTLAWVDPSVLEAGGTGRARWVGIFNGPGVFCVVFTVALGICLPQVEGGNRLTKSLLASAVIVLLCIATYLTGSRGGFLATLAVVGFFTATRGRLRTRNVIVGAVISVAALMLVPASLTSMQDSMHSAQHRVEMWAEGLEMMKQNPIFGIGRGNYRNYTESLIAHNSAIEIGGETGLIGLMLWGAFIYVCLKSAIFSWKRGTSRLDTNVGLGLVLALLGYLVSAMFVTLEYETLYFLLALCVVQSRQQPEVRLGVGEVMLGFVVLGLGLISLQLFVTAYMS